MSKALELIQTLPLFRPFSAEIHAALDMCGQTRSYRAGDVLIEEGSVGDEIYLILDGRVKVTCSSNPQSGESELIYLERGEIIGEMTMIARQPRSASIIAEGDVEVKVWRASTWRDLCDKYPKFGYELVLGLARILCERLRRTNANVAVLNSVLWGRASASE